MRNLYNIYARLFASPLFYRLNHYLFRLALSGLGILNHKNQSLSGEKYFIENILPSYIDREPVLLDVGANIGKYSISLVNQFPEAKLHIFEPHPKNYQVLKKNKFTPNTKLNNLALSDESGSIELYDYKEKDGSTHASIYKGVIENIHGGNAISHTVRKSTLDEYLETNDIKFVDFLKIDVEGHELDVLQGAVKAISLEKIKIIHFEFNEMNVESGVFLKDFLDLLKGYTFFRMLPSSLLPLKKYRPVTHEIFAYQNIIAVQNKFLKKNSV